MKPELMLKFFAMAEGIEEEIQINQQLLVSIASGSYPCHVIPVIDDMTRVQELAKAIKKAIENHQSFFCLELVNQEGSDFEAFFLTINSYRKTCHILSALQ